ncbi:hypothetical protein SDJN02_24422, partial [Cucurbita argyrosperma subsp. argyrosperma]
MCRGLLGRRCRLLLLLPFLVAIVVFGFFSVCSSSYADVDPPPLIIRGDGKDRDHQHYGYSSKFSSMLTTRLEKMASSPVASSEIFNVDDYGAMGDGEDDSEAFKEAWKEACSSTNAIFLVPIDRTYHLKPITFSGPCNSPFAFKPCKEAPTVFWGSPKRAYAQSGAYHTIVESHKCSNVKALNLWIYAPGNSPNTDGIHVTATQIILIQNCLIMTGDDCISIVSGSKNVRAKGITCGPGHGISIGSLGAGKSEAEVSNVVVDTAKFTGTSNGVRIKTWQGGKGYAENIIFQNIVMDNVTNPIIIDQNYCDQKEPCTQQAEAVQVSNVMYQNIRGTSGSEVAVKFDCSKSFPCQEILLQDIDLVHRDKADDKPTQAEASCKNARLKNRGRVSPQCPGRR